MPKVKEPVRSAKFLGRLECRHSYEGPEPAGAEVSCAVCDELATAKAQWKAFREKFPSKKFGGMTVERWGIRSDDGVIKDGGWQIEGSWYGADDCGDEIPLDLEQAEKMLQDLQEAVWHMRSN